MIILGIETSCDETSAAVVKDGRQVFSNVIASQVDIHAPFGGVVPEIAARRHIECIGYIVDEAVAQAGLSLADIDAYAVANGPGLAGALLVGLNYAKGLAYANKKPLMGVHHIEAHVCANYLGVDQGDLKPPFLSLVVSGGHTSILAIDDYDTYRVLGSTRDDAAGEAFDKTARILGLPYPGGPQIDKLAQTGNGLAAAFPRAKMDGLDFSFSGLKTAVMQYKAKHTDTPVADIAASFQKAVVDVLVDRTVTACLREGYSTVALAGGVACNKGLRTAMEAACKEKGLRLFMPQPIYCTDNAAMIACRGYYSLVAGKADGWDLNAFPGRMV
ncbi:MAG: tRNA (adenosine(37)-N6)-threonylcarbamoyltransferase complex transferase subunit TsaD [Firmicutes bacterium]|nr:tRNA (adenosine(37)-N6)-threonylcarbamoyltransferase complex transferase subunit TsaD [Bacillota bacterium]